MNDKDPFSLNLPLTRDPVVATSLSVIPGLGQIYNSEPRKGILFFLVGFTNIVLITTLTWSKQLVNSLQALSHELNMVPNHDIVGALSNFNAGSPAFTILLALFISFIAYAMRDAYDRARIVRRSSIYSPVAMHISEATSGSYLFHSVLMTTLVLFAFFFLLPSPPKEQVIDIEFVNPTVEAKKKPRTNKASEKNTDAVRDPNLTRTVRNPAPSTEGARPQQAQRPSKPAESKPQESKPSEAKPPQQPKAEPVKQDSPAAAKPTEAPPTPPTIKPNISPVRPQAATNPVPNPLRPPAPQTVAAPPVPNLQTPSVQPKVAMDPSKLLANLMPVTAPSNSAVQLPAPTGVAVKTGSGAPPAVASHIATPSAFGQPQPGIATSSRSSGPSSTPKIVEAGGRPNNKPGTGSNIGITPTRSSESGGNDNGKDAGNFGALRPNLPPGDAGQKPGGRTAGEPGNPDTGRIGQTPSIVSKEVDFSKYMANLQRRIKQAWFPPRDELSKRVKVRFTISTNGNLSGLTLAGSSGSAVADNAALKAVSNAAPFAHLPEGAPDSVDIEFTFDYNVFKGSGQVLRSW